MLICIIINIVELIFPSKSIDLLISMAITREFCEFLIYFIYVNNYWMFLSELFHEHIYICVYVYSKLVFPHCFYNLEKKDFLLLSDNYLNFIHKYFSRYLHKVKCSQICIIRFKTCYEHLMFCILVCLYI